MYRIITEGKTRLYVPVEGSFGKRASGKDKKPSVFYNPHMRLNRSLNVLFMQATGKRLVFGDMLAGTGAKGIRIAFESGNPVSLNDANESAAEIIKKNAVLNSVDVSISNLGANQFIHVNRGKFDFIDIDPFGSPVPFLDSALLATKKTGYMGATATDVATLCGVYPDTCLRRYQAKPLRSMFCHEVGLRILLGYIARSAAKYDRGIRPLLSHSTRHYFRLYVHIKKGVRAAKTSLQSLGHVHYCGVCKDFSTELGLFPSKTSCSCKETKDFSGPLWIGNLHESSLLSKMLSFSRKKETEKLLKTLVEEIDAPFYYNVHLLSKDIRATPPTMEIIISRLRDAGYQASRTHFSSISVKTDAPVEQVKKALF
jgi:tRNA (guanine26-N2/guanine27-N2)-dimethyltransferase